MIHWWSKIHHQTLDTELFLAVCSVTFVKVVVRVSFCS